MSFKKLIAVTASALVLQGCVASLGGTKVPTEVYQWDDKASFAMNVMRSADIANRRVKDTEIPASQAQLKDFSAAEGVLTGLSSWNQASGFMGMSGGASLGLGVLSWLASDSHRDYWKDLSISQAVMFIPVTSTALTPAEANALSLKASGAVVDSLVGAWRKYQPRNRLKYTDFGSEIDGEHYNALYTDNFGNHHDVEFEAEVVGVTDSYPHRPGPHAIVHILPDVGFDVVPTWPGMLEDDIYLWSLSESIATDVDPDNKLKSAIRLYSKKGIHLFVIPVAEDETVTLN